MRKTFSVLPCLLVALLVSLVFGAAASAQTTPNNNILQVGIGNCDGCTPGIAVMPKSVTAGSGLVVIGQSAAGALSSNVPTDLQGDTFAVVKYVSFGMDIKIWATCSAIGGATNVSLAGTTYVNMHVLEVAGMPSSGCSDATGSAQHVGASTQAQSVATTGSLAQAQELVIAAFGVTHTVTTSISAGAESTLAAISFGSASGQGNVNLMTEVGANLSGLSGIQTSTATLNNAPDGAGANDAAIATFKLSSILTGGGGGGSGPSSCSGICVPVNAVLSWASAGSGLTYNIYQSTSSGGTYTKIAGGVSALTYTDATTINPGASNYYEISAVDASGNEGTKSAPTVAVIPSTDSIAVAMPTPSSPVVVSGGLTESAIAASGITQSGATITWTTNVAADSQVGYSVAPSTSYKFSPCCNPANVTSHSVALTGLAPGTTYNFVVDSTMAAAPGTELVSTPLQFTTVAVSNLSISGVAAGSISQTGATVTWNTNVAGSSRVGYAVSPSTTYTFTSVDSTQVTAHSVAITGLTAGTKYNFIVESVGGSPSATIDSPVANFTTASPTPIAITSVLCSNVTTSGVTISWTTDQASTSQVLFAISPSTSLTSGTVSDTGGVTSHTVNLTGLQSNTVYNFEVKSVSTSNSSVSSVSALQQFTTAQVATTLTNVAATNVNATTATITWMTNLTANSQVGYAVSPSTSYTFTSITDTGGVSSHSVTLSGLSANTKYNFVAKSNSVQSPVQQFTTLNNTGSFTVSAISVTGLSSSGATVNWTTSLAADSQVGYAIAPSTSYKFSPCCNPANVTSHSVALTGLQSGTKYNFVVDSTMTAAPQTEIVSPAQSFTTSGAGGTGGGPAALSISGVGVSNVSQTSATIVWTTNNLADSNVGTAASPSTSYSFGTTNTTKTVSHSFSVSGLTAGTTYNFEVRSNDGTTTVTSPSAIFTTSAVVATGGGGGTPGTDCNISQSGCTGPAGPVKAFPSAQGAGAASVGGRGGAVYEVTTANDTGTGSLRACIEDANNLGPRTCIFRLSYQSTNRTRLQIRSPFITIAGQTAPGSPVTLHSAGSSNCTDSSGCTTIFVSTHDFIIRYISYDGFAVTTGNPVDTGTVGFEYASGNIFNGITDHVTSKWWGNASFDQFANSGGPVHELTGQFNLFYEPNVTHEIVLKFDATSGSALASVNLDFHHNMGVNFARRWPLSAVHSIRFVNNIAYDWANNGSGDGDFLSLSWGGLLGDYIGNKYVSGPDTNSHTHPITVEANNSGPDASNNCTNGNPCDNPGPPSLYLLNNIGETCSATPLGCSIGNPVSPTHVVNDATQKSLTFQGWEGGETTRSGITSGTCKNPDGTTTSCLPLAPLSAGWFRSTPLPTETYPITQDAAENLDAVILNTVGNSQHLDCNGNWVPNRDPNDTRVINQYKNHGSGQPFALSGSPQYSTPNSVAGTPCQESMHDGVPDQWKSLVGISVSTNAAKTFAPNHYTYLENYLNGTNPNK